VAAQPPGSYEEKTDAEERAICLLLFWDTAFDGADTKGLV